MKILFLQTNYPGFLNSFYEKLGDTENLTYTDLKNKWASEFFGSSNFYLKNLKPLGWEGDEIIMNDWIMQSKWMHEHKLKISKNQHHMGLNILPQRIKNLFGLNSWMKKIFFAQVKKIKPDIIYLHDITILNSSDLKTIHKYTKLIVGQIAYPLPLNRNVLKSFDLLISSFPHFVKMFRDMEIKSEYLKWCVEGNLAKQIGEKKRVYDVSYVGGFSPHHSKGNKILDEVSSEVKIDFWGYNVNFLPINSPIRKTYHGEVWGKDMYEIFASSKIVINRHINISENYANNMRMYDSTAMGALLITDDKSNMSEFFEVGKEVITYKSPTDLINKIKYYLSHPKEREKIAKEGQKRTLKDHTYEVRMRELDIILRKHLKSVTKI